MKVSSGGSAGSPVTLASAPGAIATIVGRFWIAQGANYVSVVNLRLDGKNSDVQGGLPSPTVNSNDDTFSYDEVTNENTAICFAIGSSSYGTAAGTVVDHSLVHNCGVLPAANHDHGFYVQDATNTTIAYNLIYNNADRGIQLYPDAQNTTVDHNVIVGNGENFDFSGDDGMASNNADVYANIIADPVSSYNVYAWYPSGNPIGAGNVLQNNCVYGGSPAIDASTGGFSATNNTTANPQFINAATGNYQLASTSPCRAITGDIAATGQGPTAA